ncbi:hypothetical protein GOBAR_AA23481 [Gossypium barbadense]|uniref:MINDY deubiquitinase domain-containing protein n=1 Tax=Gossypium barbadense TaxID=3634 RepID=A0A2P5X1H8_GOSBA|nr:hypothetical protein GOBAR_AA23481 [Gossypium barbadense]
MTGVAADGDFSSSLSKEKQVVEAAPIREGQNQEQQKQEGIKGCMHKTKTIQFLGRTTPIILQNDNGPCPLLAICNFPLSLFPFLGFCVLFFSSSVTGNVLLLRNNLNLSPDIAEVSQEKLLSLVAERLIDSNSNVNNKDEGFVENQQQNIADAIDLLPRLATGIDVNIKFRRIDDFEFTPECAIFDLLDIPLYHGWIVDPQTDGINQNSSYVKSGDGTLSNDAVENMAVKVSSADDLLQIEGAVPISLAEDTAPIDGNNTENSQGGENIEIQSTSATDAHYIPGNINGFDPTEVSSISLQKAGSDSSSDRIHNADVLEAFSSSLDGSEPIYEGEDCILDSVTTYENREPIYEGEVILAKQADNISVEVCTVRSKEEITPQQGELIANFLKNNANQLTFYGLFCLQDGLKERELCVFFRNNHFSTMFKYDGELYLLATDQGYLNQPDLVWEKLNEVNGDTLFMTGNFKEFKVDSHATGTWDEQNATADYIAGIDGSAHARSDEISDLQLAIALQQEEYEQQPQRQNVRPPPIVGATRLVTGPKSWLRLKTDDILVACLNGRVCDFGGTSLDAYAGLDHQACPVSVSVLNP